MKKKSGIHPCPCSNGELGIKIAIGIRITYTQQANFILKPTMHTSTPEKKRASKKHMYSYLTIINIHLRKDYNTNKKIKIDKAKKQKLIPIP